MNEIISKIVEYKDKNYLVKIKVDYETYFKKSIYDYDKITAEISIYLISTTNTKRKFFGKKEKQETVWIAGQLSLLSEIYKEGNFEKIVKKAIEDYWDEKRTFHDFIESWDGIIK